jgi:hypothetical protein
VETLHRVALARYEYEDVMYCGTRGLARKCMFALGKIGTPEAIRVLEDLRASGEPNLKAHAEEQFEILRARPNKTR